MVPSTVLYPLSTFPSTAVSYVPTANKPGDIVASYLGLPHVAVVPNQTLPISVHPQECCVAQQAHATPREKYLDVAMGPEGVLLSPEGPVGSNHRYRPAGPG